MGRELEAAQHKLASAHNGIDDLNIVITRYMRELAEARGLLRSVLMRNPLIHPTSRNEIIAFLAEP
jgi:hypothetical protein